MSDNKIKERKDHSALTFLVQCSPHCFPTQEKHFVYKLNRSLCLVFALKTFDVGRGSNLVMLKLEMVKTFYCVHI